MRDLNGSRVLSLSLLLAVGAGATSGCDCGGTVVTPDDTGRMPRDAGSDSGAVVEDDASIDANAPAIDTNPTLDDAFVPGGPDAPLGMALNCVHTHSLGDDYFRLSRDGDADNPPATSVATRAGEMVGVFSTSNDAGTRSLQVFRRTAAGEIIAPATIPNSTGANLPNIVATTDGYWIAYQQGTNVIVARVNADFTMSTPSTVGTGPITTAPQLVKTSTGGFVAWITGGDVRGRALDAMGAASGTERTLDASAMPIRHMALQRVGAEDAVSITWSDGVSRPSVAPVNVAAGTVGAVMPLAGEFGAFSSLDTAGQSVEVVGGRALDGAGVYDLEDGASRDVVFRVLTATGATALPAATVGIGGDLAWAPSVDTYLSGYLIAYRARLVGGTSTFLRVGYLDRNGCDLGIVTDRFPLGQIDSDRGAAPQVTTSGNDVLIVWSDATDSYNDYWAATMSCTER